MLRKLWIGILVLSTCINADTKPIFPHIQNPQFQFNNVQVSPCPQLGRYGNFCDKIGKLSASQHCSMNNKGDINGQFHRKTGRLLHCVGACSFGGHTGSTCSLVGRLASSTTCGELSDVSFSISGELKHCRSCVNGYQGARCSIKAKKLPNCAIVSNLMVSHMASHEQLVCIRPYTQRNRYLKSLNNSTQNTTKTCPTGYFGHQCKSKTRVHPYCKTVPNTGNAYKYGSSFQIECASCYPGYSGRTCSFTTQVGPPSCPSGRFGYLCQIKTVKNRFCKTVNNTGLAFKFGFRYQSKCASCYFGYSGTACHVAGGVGPSVCKTGHYGYRCQLKTKVRLTCVNVTNIGLAFVSGYDYQNCTSCIPGYNGSHCQNSNDGAYNSCKAGYHGYQCRLKTFSRKTCINVTNTGNSFLHGYRSQTCLSCNPGYSGSHCHIVIGGLPSTCKAGYYGYRCQLKTKVRLTCVNVTNIGLAFQHGYNYQNCISCIPGYNGSHCQNSNDGAYSTCKTGYHGYQCQLKTLSRKTCINVTNTGNSFLHGYRSQTCVSCKLGYTGRYCQTINAPSTCQTGYYGYQCRRKTKVHLTCVNVTNTGSALRIGFHDQMCTSCIPGYSGIYCENSNGIHSICKVGFYGYQCRFKTKVRPTCMNVTNTGSAFRLGYYYQECTSCIPGYSGSYCETSNDGSYSTCKTGYHGYRCRLRTKVRPTCVNVTNTGYAFRNGYYSQNCTSCIPGYSGRFCETSNNGAYSTCKTGYYGYQCGLKTRVRQACVNVTNTGESFLYGYIYQTCVSCKPGYSHDFDCLPANLSDTYSSCKTGHYGYQCRLRTKVRPTCINVTNTGRAFRFGYYSQNCTSCIPGYSGRLCQSANDGSYSTCKTGYFGYRCQLKTQVYITCINVTNTGHAFRNGYHSQNCTSCIPGYSGSYCETSNDGAYSTCKTGYHGYQCRMKTKAPPTCISVSNTGFSFLYGFSHQSCVSCKPGYIGSHCQTFNGGYPGICQTGYYGYQCRYKTKAHSTCINVTNTGNSYLYGYPYQTCVSCKLGYSGSRCQTPNAGAHSTCKTGYYGRQCKLRTMTQPYCKTVPNTGSAFKHGYTYQRECSNCHIGYSGSFCNITSNSGPNICPSGSFGYKCQLTTNMFKNCKSVSNSGLAFQYGYMHQSCHSCSRGYTGSKCASKKLQLSEFWTETDTKSLIRLIQHENGNNVSFVEVKPRSWEKASGYVVMQNGMLFMKVMFDGMLLVGTLNRPYQQIFWNNNKIWVASSTESTSKRTKSSQKSTKASLNNIKPTPTSSKSMIQSTAPTPKSTESIRADSTPKSTESIRADSTPKSTESVSPNLNSIGSNSVVPSIFILAFQILIVYELS